MHLREQEVMLVEYERVRELKIPFHDKLPKDTTFYSYFINMMGEEKNSQVQTNQNQKTGIIKDHLEGKLNAFEPREKVVVHIVPHPHHRLLAKRYPHV